MGVRPRLSRGGGKAADRTQFPDSKGHLLFCRRCTRLGLPASIFASLAKVPAAPLTGRRWRFIVLRLGSSYESPQEWTRPYKVAPVSQPGEALTAKPADFAVSSRRCGGG